MTKSEPEPVDQADQADTGRRCGTVRSRRPKANPARARFAEHVEQHAGAASLG